MRWDARFGVLFVLEHDVDVADQVVTEVITDVHLLDRAVLLLKLPELCPPPGERIGEAEGGARKEGNTGGRPSGKKRKKKRRRKKRTRYQTTG